LANVLLSTICEVTSVTLCVTNTRAVGPLDFSSARDFAMKPFFSRFADGEELSCKALVAQ
jgi:hypothetical protein